MRGGEGKRFFKHVANGFQLFIGSLHSMSDGRLTQRGKNCTLMNAPRGIFATFPPQASARFIAGIGPVANYTIARPSCQKNYTVISVSLNLISRLPRCRDTVNFLSEPSLKLPHRSTSVCVPAFYYTRYRATRCHGDIQRSDTP